MERVVVIKEMNDVCIEPTIEIMGQKNDEANATVVDL